METSHSGQAGRLSSDTVAMPSTFGRYRIERELGQGAMGIVYLAEDTQLGRKVALKIPQRAALEDPAALERFYREAKTSSQIRHPLICPVFDVGAIDGTHYLTMAYIPGKPISSFLRKGKPPAEKAVASLFRKLALALAEAHKQGVVHRDLKPSNVMLDDRNEPIIMDFGLARQMNTTESARITQSGAIVGTPAYMAPEQIQGDAQTVGPQCDIYSLGVMLYQFLTGQLPFDGPVLMVLAQIMTAQPPRPSERRPGVDPTLESICLTMMARDPAQRFASMNDVAAALSAFLKSKSAASGDGDSAKSGELPATSLRPVAVSDPESSSRELKNTNRPRWKKLLGERPIRTVGIGGGILVLTAAAAVIAWLARPPHDQESVAKADGQSSAPFSETVVPNQAQFAETQSAKTDLNNGPGGAASVSTRGADAGNNTVIPASSETPAAPAPSRPRKTGSPTVDPPTDNRENPDRNFVPRPKPVPAPKRPQGPPPQRRDQNQQAVGTNAAPPPFPRRDLKPASTPVKPPTEAEKTLQMYAAAVAGARKALRGRFDKTIREVEKSKGDAEERNRMISLLKAERETFQTHGLVPFSKKMRKYAVAYQNDLLEALRASRNRLKKYHASPVDIEAAEAAWHPTLLGVWRCRSGDDEYILRLKSDLKVESDFKPRNGSWTLDTDAFLLKFPDAAAPGGQWLFKCDVNQSGQTFTASHHKAAEIKGTRIDPTNR